MFCAAYRKSLEDAAAGAAAPPRVLAHLAICPRCAHSFAAEQALHLDIGTELATIANASVSPSLLPRIREVVSQERLSSRLPLGLVWASSVTVAVLVLAVFLPHLFRPVVAPGPAIVVQPPPSPRGARNNRQAHAPSVPRQIPARSASPILTALRPSAADPEVLVPPGQEIALRKYAEILRKNAESEQPMSKPEIREPLTIEAIEISALEGKEIQIDPLARDSQDLSR